MNFKLNKPFKSLLIATAVASLAACGGKTVAAAAECHASRVISGSGSLKFGATALNIAVGSSATDTVTLDTKDIGSGHFYMAPSGSYPTAENIYDCDGVAATCTVIPNLGGSTINHAYGSIYSLSITHY